MAKKAAAAKPSADELVKTALLAVASATSPLRLSGKAKEGEPPALFATASGANKEAIDQLTATDKPLLSLTGPAKSQTVVLTAAGFTRIADSLPEEKLAGAAKSLAAGLPVADRVAFLQEIVRRTPVATAELLPVLEAAISEEKTESAARAAREVKRREAEAASLAALERWKAALKERQKARIEALRKELAAEGADPGEGAPPPRPEPAKPERGPSLVAGTPEEKDFRRNVARRLVSSWLEAWDANKPDAREYLEAAIWNVSGFRQVGEPGQRATLDGRYHEGPAGLFPGDAVRVVRPGWVLEEDDDREYVVVKARVEK